MSEIRVDNILSADGSAAPTYSQGVNVAAGKTFTNSGDFTTSGISSFSGATTFAQGAVISGLSTFSSGVSGINVVGPATFTQGAVATGVVTFTGLSITAGTVAHTGGITVGGASTFSNTGEFTGNLTVGGNISCAGTITYDDVQSVDSIGIVTARQDLKVLRNASVSGVTTLTGATEIAGNLTAGGNIVGDNSTNISGISSVTATTYYGSGTNLTGIDATSLKDSGGNTKIQANAAGAVVTGILTATTLDSPEIDTLTSNIAMLGFKIAANNTLNKYNLVNQIIDEYQDTSGIDAGASSGESLGGSGAAQYYSGFSPGNYFGSGGDGDVTISSNTNLTVSNTSGS